MTDDDEYMCVVEFLLMEVTFGVIGGILILFTLGVVVFIFWRRKRIRKRNNEKNQPHNENSSTIQQNKEMIMMENEMNVIINETNNTTTTYQPGEFDILVSCCSYLVDESYLTQHIYCVCVNLTIRNVNATLIC